MRREFSHEKGNGDQLKPNIDYPDEVRDEASQRIAMYQQKMASYYNQWVKLKRFSIGDLILRKTQHMENWDQYGKAFTGLSTTQDKEVSTWKHWTVKI